MHRVRKRNSGIDMGHEKKIRGFDGVRKKNRGLGKKIASVIFFSNPLFFFPNPNWQRVRKKNKVVLFLFLTLNFFL